MGKAPLFGQTEKSQRKPLRCESIELKSGDVARVIAVPTDAVGRLVLWDGEEYIEYFPTTEH